MDIDLSYIKDNNIKEITTKWQSQQVAGILIIIFFGIISIVYVFFMNTYIIREKDVLLDSNYKIPFLLLVLISSIFIISIMSYNVNDYSGYVISFVIILNILIFGFKFLLKTYNEKITTINISSITDTFTKTFTNTKESINKIEFVKYILKFFDYGNSSECNNTICGYLEYFNFSTISPFLLFLFIFLAINTSSTIIYSIMTLIIFIEYWYKGRINILNSISLIWQILYVFIIISFNFLLYLT